MEHVTAEPRINSLTALAEVLERVVYAPKQFRYGYLGDGYFLQIVYMEDDVRTGEPQQQRGRKWYVSKHATESEVVQTALGAALASAEHQVREAFMYRPTAVDEPRRVYGPHFHAAALWAVCGQSTSFDARPEPAAAA